MDNLFILKLQENNLNNILNRNHSTKIIKFLKLHKIAANIIKFFNITNPYIKLKFKNDTLNWCLGIKYSRKFDSKENLLRGGMTSVEQAINMYHLLSQVILLNVPGDIVELGCYEGTTSILIQKTLDKFNSKKKLHVYDSFEGLPETSTKDGRISFRKGSCKTTKDRLIYNFERMHVLLPEIHEGWFKDTLPTQLPEKICFAHLDGDLYSSIKESLEYIYPHLSKGAIVIIDDYCNPKVHNVNNILPGVKKACDDFFKNKKEQIHVLLAGCETHGYFKKQ